MVFASLRVGTGEILLEVHGTLGVGNAYFSFMEIGDFLASSSDGGMGENGSKDLMLESLILGIFVVKSS